MQPLSPVVCHGNELYNTNRPSTRPQTVVPIRVHVLGMLATVTIQGQCLFHSELLILRLLIGILATASVVIVLAWLKKKSNQCRSKEIAGQFV